MNAALLVAALGYFVDVFDILLFSVLRVPSLKDLGLPADQILPTGVYILNLQLTGLISGGLLWGIWGDKFGRLSVLFTSILVYSLASLGCAFVHNVDTYAWLRFAAGFGLAGELGVGITLVSELLPKEQRGWGTTFVTGVGVAGAIAGGLLGDWLSWRVCYGVGGVLGLFLLAARIGVRESTAFLDLKERTQVVRGNIVMLFSNWARVKRYVACMFLGYPIMFVVYVMATFSPEIAKAHGIAEPITGAQAIVYCYIGITAGDVLFGVLSQILKSRRRSSLISILTLSVTLAVYLISPPTSRIGFLLYIMVFGMCSANWAVIVTSCAEQFGTNLRATATTSIPNMIRGSAILLTFGFRYFQQTVSTINSAILVGSIALVIALLALFQTRETYGKDLSFLEE